MSFNPFLDKFVASQMKLIQSTVPQQAEKKDKNGRTKSKHGTADGRSSFPEGDRFAMLCQEKPSKKHVLAYFRDRIAELVAAEEF
jgi:hypothetical protein